MGVQLVSKLPLSILGFCGSLPCSQESVTGRYPSQFNAFHILAYYYLRTVLILSFLLLLGLTV